MLDYLRKHTIVIMAAMALVFVGLMFVGGDVSGGSLTGMFRQTFVSVDGKSYGEKDYNNMGWKIILWRKSFFRRPLKTCTSCLRDPLPLTLRAP